MMGAGVKRAYSHGATDDFGYEAVQDVTSIYDLHATMLHILGSRDRSRAGPTAPAHGLFLVRVEYSPRMTLLVS